MSSHLDLIQQRHGHDRWRDAVFVGAALVIALAIAAPTRADLAPAPGPRTAWSVTVIEGRPEVQPSVAPAVAPARRP